MSTASDAKVADAKAKRTVDEADAEAKAKAGTNIDAVVGETLPMSLVWLDTDGKPMRVTPMPDAPPVWAEVLEANAPDIGVLVVAPDGLSAIETIKGPGTETVQVDLMVDGEPFAAMRTLTVPEVKAVKVPEQKLGSVAIVVPGEADESDRPPHMRSTPRPKAKP